MKTQGELDKEMIGRDLKVYVKAHAPNIPTGADYHILKAKSALKDMEHSFQDSHTGFWKLQDAMLELVRALELIQQEREKEKEAK